MAPPAARGGQAPMARAAAYGDIARLEQLLDEQVTGSVRWRESVMWMAGNGVPEIWEIGAGKALSGMIRRIAREIECRPVGTPEEVKAAAPAPGEAREAQEREARARDLFERREA